jgi:hypothetical protein
VGLVDNLVLDNLKKSHDELCNLLNSNVIFYYGPLVFNTPSVFDESINKIRHKKASLSIVLTTSGGSVEPTEKAVEIIRNNFRQVNFIVPDYAMSAGTIFCMSGNRILMSNSSSLGPIDPQLQLPDGSLIPALGYLEQLEKLINKSKSGEITAVEIDMLRRLDLGDINRYEQARNLTITLLKKWLVTYKFRNWKTHRSTPSLKGKPVTIHEKENKAEEIARQLGDVTLWHSHGRHISAETLKSKLKLKIENYSQKNELKNAINCYQGIAIDYIQKNAFLLFIHGEDMIKTIRAK